jgi:riboflavin synthase
MFTGIVEELGRVVTVESGTESARLTVAGPTVLGDAAAGASIAVNGVCLTVAELGPDGASFTADVMAESLRRTTLGDLVAGSPVNLERPLRADGRFGGHVVQGHVDGVGVVVGRVPGDRWELVTIETDGALARYVVEKGSVTVDGVSLTVTEVAPTVDHSTPGGRTRFSVSLIPETLRRTTLGLRTVGERVNVEVDVLAKYVERMLSSREVTR